MNFIKAPAEVLQSYGIDTTTDRTLLDGDVIIHFEKKTELPVIMKGDERITYWTEEALREYIEFVLGE